jgi:hypothetical protein
MDRTKVQFGTDFPVISSDHTRSETEELNGSIPSDNVGKI